MSTNLMKIILGMLVSLFLIAALLFTALPTPVMAVYPSPVGGTVTLDGTPAPVGTVVEVYVDGFLNDTVTIDIAGEYFMFNDGSQNLEGKALTFTVNGFMAISDPPNPLFQLSAQTVNLLATSGPQEIVWSFFWGPDVFPKHLPSNTVQVSLADLTDIPEGIYGVYWADPVSQSWKSFMPGFPDWSDLVLLVPGESYSVAVGGAVDWHIPLD